MLVARDFDLSADFGAGGERRGAILVRAGDLLEDRRKEFARLIAREGGKPLMQARGEVGYAAGCLRFSASEAESVLAPQSHPHLGGKRVRTLRRPAKP